MPTKPLTDQRAAQLFNQPLGEPAFGDVQLAALDHAALYLHVKPGGAASAGSVVRQFQEGPDAEFRRLAERPLPATELRCRTAESGERRLVIRVNMVQRRAEAELLRLEDGEEHRNIRKGAQ